MAKKTKNPHPDCADDFRSSVDFLNPDNVKVYSDLQRVALLDGPARLRANMHRAASGQMVNGSTAATDEYYLMSRGVPVVLDGVLSADEAAALQELKEKDERGPLTAVGPALAELAKAIATSPIFVPQGGIRTLFALEALGGPEQPQQAPASLFGRLLAGVRLQLH